MRGVKHHELEAQPVARRLRQREAAVGARAHGPIGAEPLGALGAIARAADADQSERAHLRAGGGTAVAAQRASDETRDAERRIVEACSIAAGALVIHRGPCGVLGSRFRVGARGGLDVGDGRARILQRRVRRRIAAAEEQEPRGQREHGQQQR
jgi:hypothetical protein